MELITTTNTIFVVLTVLGQIAALGLLILLIWKPRIKLLAQLRTFAGKYGFLFGFLIALASTAGSLFYSMVIGWDPCSLCWYQRIFMYPLVLIFALAMWRKEEERLADYAILLSIPGLLLTLYHHLLQMGVVSFSFCSADVAHSCAQRFIFELGYITMPFMALVAFVLIILLVLARKQYAKESH
jgi:disulfide bond formation protein DsbB